jgi:Mg-chelatase subunit ChlD
MRVGRHLLTLTLCLPVAGPGVAAETDTPAALEFEYPADTQAIGGAEGVGFVAARIRPREGVDLMLVLDASESMKTVAGDVDRDGKVTDPQKRSLGNLFRGDGPKTPPDSRFAAELRVAEALLARLDRRVTRVGLITFSGDTEAETPDAAVEVPLTYDHEKVRQALAALRERGPSGRSNLLEAVQRATVELAATESAVSEARPGALRAAYLFTDGNPTLPLPRSTAQNRRLAIAGAVKASERGVTIHTYGFGGTEEVVMVEIGRVTRGSYQRLEARRLACCDDPPAVSLVRAPPIAIENRTTGAEASAIDVSLDGSVFALVPMQPGPNQLALIARFAVGQPLEHQLEVVLDVRFDPAAPADPPDAVQVEARERLGRQLASPNASQAPGVSSAPGP